MGWATTIMNLFTPSSAIKSAVSTAAKESDSLFERTVETALGRNVIADATPRVGTGTVFSQPTQTRTINDILGPDKFKKFNNPNIKKFANPEFENFSKKFINSEPELLFVCEYFVDGVSIGVLCVWERFPDATHYEVFKKNLFSADAKFERVLFLDSVRLEEETTYYIDYIQKVLGISINQDEIYIMLDTTIKEDRIYEYRIRAARVPKAAAEVDYDFILEGKKLTKEVAVDDVSVNTIFDFAGVTLGSKDLAWTIAVMNETVPYFGRGPFEKPIGSLDLPLNENQDKFIMLANDSQNILKIFNESISLFNLKDTITNLINSLGGLPVDFREAFLDSVDEVAKTFSYDFFKKQIRSKSPVYNLILDVSETANIKKADVTSRLSKLSIALPTDKGSESLSSVEKLTRILAFVNKTFLAVIYAQDDTGKLQEMLEELRSLPTPPDPVAQAVLVAEVPFVVAETINLSNVITANGSDAILSAPPTNTGILTQAIKDVPVSTLIAENIPGANVTPNPATTPVLAAAVATPSATTTATVASVDTSRTVAVATAPATTTTQSTALRLTQESVSAGSVGTAGIKEETVVSSRTISRAGRIFGR